MANQGFVLHDEIITYLVTSFSTYSHNNQAAE